jgi:hypothetical protein
MPPKKEESQLSEKSKIEFTPSRKDLLTAGSI